MKTETNWLRKDEGAQGSVAFRVIKGTIGSEVTVIHLFSDPYRPTLLKAP